MRSIKKIQIYIRSQVRSRAYKSALGDGLHEFICGFLLGHWEMPYEEARIEFALPTEIVNPTGLKSITEQLDLLFDAAKEVAEFCNTKVIGIFAAYDAYLSVGQNQLIGYFCDFACHRGLSYFLQFPTDGGETIWGVGVYNAKWFPHVAFSYQMVTQRASDKPYDNPRRVHRLWNRLSTAQLLESAKINRRQVYVWRQEFSCERLELIEQTRRMRKQLFHESDSISHFARIQLSGDKNLISGSSFDGVIDGRKSKIYLKVIPLRLWYAAELYRRALAHTEERYPGFDRHHFEDGPRIGERVLVFDSDTHMLAWHHLGTALWKIIKDEKITACESCTVAPYADPVFGYKIQEGHYSVTLVIDREPVTKELLQEIEEVFAKGETWPLSETRKSYDYYKELDDLFSELSYPELVVLNREEAVTPLSDVDRELFEACSYLDINKMRLALHRGANPNAIRSEYIDTPLKELVQSILNNRGAIQNPDEKDWFRGKLPVVQLAASDKVAMVELLLKYGAHPDLHWFEENIPLAIAACNDEAEIVETLLKHGSDPSIQSFYDTGITYWPTAWEYATDELHDRTEEEWQAHERIVAMLENLRPTPYYLVTETSLEQPQEQRLVEEKGNPDLDCYEEIQRQAPENPLVLELTAAEREYIDSSSNPTLGRLCYYIALAYNTYEPRWILEHCSPEIEYSSQSVFQTLQGIIEYGNYLKKKLKTLSEVDSSRQARFELGISPFGQPCVIGYQQQGGFSAGTAERLLWMDVEHNNQGQFLKIYAVTSVPPVSDALGTGLFPGIS